MCMCVIKWRESVARIHIRLLKMADFTERLCEKSRGKWYIYIYFCGIWIFSQGSCIKCMIMIS